MMSMSPDVHVFFPIFSQAKNSLGAQEGSVKIHGKCHRKSEKTFSPAAVFRWKRVKRTALLSICQFVWTSDSLSLLGFQEEWVINRSQTGYLFLLEIHGKTSSSSSSSSHRRRQYKGKTTSEKHSPQDSQFYGGTKTSTTSEDGEDNNNDGSSFTSDSHSSHFLEDVSSTSSSSPISSSPSSTFARDVMIIFSVRGIFLLSFRILHKVFSLSCICYPRIVYRLSSCWWLFEPVVRVVSHTVFFSRGTYKEERQEKTSNRCNLW